MMENDLKPNLIVFNTALNALQRTQGVNPVWKRERGDELLAMMQAHGLQQDNFTLCGTGCLSKSISMVVSYAVLAFCLNTLAW